MVVERGAELGKWTESTDGSGDAEPGHVGQVGDVGRVGMGVDQSRKQRLALSVVSRRRWARFAGTADEVSLDNNSARREKNGAVEHAHILEDCRRRRDFAFLVVGGARRNVRSREGAIVYICEMRVISMEEA
jgi:hypothetical protein